MAGLQIDRHRHRGDGAPESTAATLERHAGRARVHETFIQCPFCESDFSIDVHSDLAVSGQAPRYPAGIGTAADAQVNFPPGSTWWVITWWLAYALSLGMLIFTGIIWF
jgi:hypothetical protein